MATTHEWSRLGDKVMDTRDLMAVAEEIREALESEDPEAIEALDVDDADEAREILESIEEIESVGIADWQYGETLIREDFFEDYARELADDIGAVDSNASWPLAHIDWEAAAEALKQDYTEVDYRGTTYYVRA